MSTVRWLLVLATAGLAGCGSNAAPADGGPSADTGPLPDGGPACTVLAWDGPGSLGRWPEPALLVADPTTETGQRIHFDAAIAPDLVTRLGSYASVFTQDLDEVDGFGVNAQAFFRFGRGFDLARVPSGDATAAPGAGLGFVVVSPGPPRIVPALVTATDGGATLMLAPMTPLPARAQVAVFVTTALVEAAGGCLMPSAAMNATFVSPDAATTAAVDALVAVGAIASDTEIIALSVFPTQSIEEDSLAVAADVATRAYDFAAPPTCIPEARWVRCEASFVAQDYRDPVDLVFRRARGEPAIPAASYALPVTFWLPLPAVAAPPYPTFLFGHGLTGDRSQAGALAAFAAPLGYATFAIDAQAHGEHPTAPTSGAALDTLFAFFGIMQTPGRALEAARLRDNFRASTWDKLQLTRLVVAHPDIDGDGTADLDLARMAYLGVSLGGLMGPEPLALGTTYRAGVLVVPGGRVASIISDGATFGPLVAALRPRGSTEGDIARFFPVLQTVIERGDPASYGPHVILDRFAASSAITPSVLVGVALDDAIVPNVSNYALARALGIPIVGPVLRPVPGMVDVPAPAVDNLAGGTATAGLLQFDLVGDGMGGAEPATHDNIGASDVGVDAWLDFMTTHFATGHARIRDPYVAIGLAHAP